MVDDDEDVQRALRRAAEAAGYDVLREFSGEHVQALVREKAADVVLLDVDMPGCDGRDVLRRLKDDPETSSEPVIMCSSRVGEFDSLTRLDLGADDYVDKPAHPAFLLARIARVLQESAMARKP